MAPHTPGTQPPGPGGPGGSSGREQQAQERTVPGTASAREGYRSGGGTADGDPLTGVETDPRDESDQDESEEPGDREDGGPDRPGRRG
ncbi:hypothetical protein [Kitasatospora phosalacinea]|uniref:hypothetical protein n=1 Tax=Kitasatospora phosalacinea TaxID=2065 RepID=UPI00068E1F9E|nr:hypothetical protein [Kitasatospora phosalacinea]